MKITIEPKALDYFKRKEITDIHVYVSGCSA